MARYSSEHKAATRRRILDVAAKRLKADGLVGSGVATLMSDAGLTNGAFYAHFASKDDLVAAVLVDQLAGQRAFVLALLADDAGDGLERFVREYLSQQHADDPGGGCPTASLLDEVARSGSEVRQRYTDGLLEVVDPIAQRSEVGDDVVSARARVLAAFAGMAGTLAMARAVTDPDLSQKLLDQGIRNALHQLGVTTAVGDRSENQEPRRGGKPPRPSPFQPKSQLPNSPCSGVS